jgi:hypothetical protein
LFPPRQGEFTANWVEFVGGGGICGRLWIPIVMIMTGNLG